MWLFLSQPTYGLLYGSIDLTQRRLPVSEVKVILEGGGRKGGGGVQSHDLN